MRSAKLPGGPALGHRARASSGRVPEVQSKVPRGLRAAKLARLHAIAALSRCRCRRDACFSAGNQRPERVAQMLAQEDRENRAGEYQQPAGEPFLVLFYNQSDEESWEFAGALPILPRDRTPKSIAIQVS